MHSLVIYDMKKDQQISDISDDMPNR